MRVGMSATNSVGVEGTIPDSSPHTEPAAFIQEMTFHFDATGETGEVVVEKRRRSKWIVIFKQAFGSEKDVVWVSSGDVVLNSDELRVTNPSGSQTLHVTTILGK